MRFLAKSVAAGAAHSLGITSRLGRKLPYVKHLFPMKTTFRHCLLVNYAMEPAVLARSLPRGLVPDTVQTPEGEKAFLSVVIADLEAMRPGFLPRPFGSDFTQVVYRAIVRAPNGERGVYFVRSDADDWPMSVVGNLFSNFNFNMARCVWAGREAVRDAAAQALEQANDPARPDIQKREWLATPSLQADRGFDRGGGSSESSSEGRSEGLSEGGSEGSSFAFLLAPRSDGFSDGEPAGVRLSVDPRSATLMMPPPSAFAGRDVREAQRYFVELYAAAGQKATIGRQCASTGHIGKWSRCSPPKRSPSFCSARRPSRPAR